jgi:hypothetical protein
MFVPVSTFFIHLGEIHIAFYFDDANEFLENLIKKKQYQQMFFCSYPGYFLI